MSFLASQIWTFTVQEWLSLECPFHSLFVKFVGKHLLLEQSSEELGDAGVLSGRFDTSPESHIFFQSYRDIAELRFRYHESSVTLI
jgi:hypothetical protein